MNRSQKKKPFNVRLFLATIALVLALLVPLAIKVIELRPDYTVTKQKITRADLEDFKKKVNKMVSDYTVRYEGKIPIVHPPGGSDIYLLAKNYDWGNYILELERGKPYRLHLATLDMRHAIVIYEFKMMNRIKVGEFKTITFTPERAGRFKIICGDYCGPKHYDMVGTIMVADSPDHGS
jgi:cytochrome c oxidase subunit 2